MRSGLIDFNMYQSGHMVETQDLAYVLARKLLDQGAGKPIVNGEPCYEGIAHLFKEDRFTAFDVRRATWHSLLSGAKAGIAYGAHGIWGWHSEGKVFDSAFVSGMPYDWRTALGFRGAWDVSLAAWLYTALGFFDLEARRDLIEPGVEASIAATDGFTKVAIYLPCDSEAAVSAALPDLAWTVVDLQERRFARPEVRVEKHRTVFEAHHFEADALILGMER
jgi:hypothetical protein